MISQDHIKELVTKQFQDEYPSWVITRVGNPRSFYDDLVVVVASKQNPNQDAVDEMCIVDPRTQRVRIFGNTEDLLHYIETKSQTPVLDRIFSSRILSGIVFSSLLLCVFIAGFFKDSFDQQALSIIGNVVGVAAGFYFGSNRDP